MKRKACLSLLLALCLLAGAVGAAEEAPELLDASELFSKRDLSGTYEEVAGSIALADHATASDAAGVVVDGNIVTITRAGVYRVTGTLTDGMLVVDTDKESKVQLVLAGVDVTSADSAALYVKKADKVFLTLAEGTENRLSAGETMRPVEEEAVDAAVYAKDDLTLNGAGKLTVNAPAGHGIWCKNDLVITGGTVEVTAALRGLSGKDSVRIAGGDVTISAGKDGIRAGGSGEDEAEADEGFLYVGGGTFHITAAGDGVSASAVMQLDGGQWTVTTGGGSANAPDTHEDKPWNRAPGGGDHGGKMPGWGGRTNGWGHTPSTDAPEDGVQPEDGALPEGMTPPEGMTLPEGMTPPEGMTLPEGMTPPEGMTVPESMTPPDRFGFPEAYDDASSSEEDSNTVSMKGFKAGKGLLLGGGAFQVDSADDAFHTNGDMTITGGTYAVSTGDDAFHADGTLRMDEGDITVNACYEGLEGETLIIGGGLATIIASDDGLNAMTQLTVTGGDVTSISQGDSLDCNGGVTLTGGVLRLVNQSVGGGEGAVDYDGTGTLDGCILLAVGPYSGMQGFSADAGQGSVLASVGSQPQGTTIVLADAEGAELLRFEALRDFDGVMLSCPGMTVGQTYQLTVGAQTQTVTAQSGSANQRFMPGGRRGW